MGITEGTLTMIATELITAIVYIFIVVIIIAVILVAIYFVFNHVVGYGKSS